MPDDLVDANQEVKVHLRLHIQRGRAKSRRVKPGKCLSRGYLMAKRWFAEVAQRKVEKACQCGTFALRQRHQSLAG